MSRFGVDYSFSRPSVNELKAAGVTFVCRYIGTASSGKNLTASEVEALQHAGIDIVANYEASSAGWMQGGRTVGVTAAKVAHADAVRLGMPSDRPIYFSADYNATYDQYKTQIRPCLQGAASVIGASRVGIYGGLEQVDWAFGDGAARWVWQTYAWSYGNWSKHSRIQQYRNHQTLGSGIVDYDRAIVADFGQWHATKEDLSIMDDATKTYIDSKFQSLADRIDRAVLRIGGKENTAYHGADYAGLVFAEDVLAAVRAGVPVALSADQFEQLKAALAGQALEGSALIQLAVSPPAATP
jgi:Rv2525c-like, glycoside hydrolase-like domain